MFGQRTKCCQYLIKYYIFSSLKCLQWFIQGSVVRMWVIFLLARMANSLNSVLMTNSPGLTSMLLDVMMAGFDIMTSTEQSETDLKTGRHEKGSPEIPLISSSVSITGLEDEVYRNEGVTQLM